MVQYRLTVIGWKRTAPGTRTKEIGAPDLRNCSKFWTSPKSQACFGSRARESLSASDPVQQEHSMIRISRKYRARWITASLVLICVALIVYARATHSSKNAYSLAGDLPRGAL